MSRFHRDAELRSSSCRLEYHGECGHALSVGRSLSLLQMKTTEIVTLCQCSCHAPCLASRIYTARSAWLDDCQPPRTWDQLTGSSATVMGPPFRQSWDHP